MPRGTHVSLDFDFQFFDGGDQLVDGFDEGPI